MVKSVGVRLAQTVERRPGREGGREFESHTGTCK